MPTNETLHHQVIDNNNIDVFLLEYSSLSTERFKSPQPGISRWQKLKNIKVNMDISYENACLKNQQNKNTSKETLPYKLK